MSMIDSGHTICASSKKTRSHLFKLNFFCGVKHGRLETIFIKINYYLYVSMEDETKHCPVLLLLSFL